MINFKDLLDGIFDEGTEEFEIIKESYELIVKTTPSISAECKTQMILLDHSRTKLSTLYYLLCREISRQKSKCQKDYDAKYTRFVKLGRPSNAAIEAEIRATSPDYAIASAKIESLEQVRELVSSYMRCIDTTKQTAVELLRDSRRID